ncbi:Acyl-CoA dehydrogenase domain protein [Desulfatibacillum aliphaticivorans]|uniref:Acyl-CoA dehydrogenase domain protein n=1 Tax=Desulfatibacillum aliphaticivorans TaxID=218208 RepID=B8FMY5_DESAL|nr:acyl-CoA dehydrogenase family protein [Desulfatibacillum aliphaticivorans]ACL05855.1 Acyl-CoA dehydrogenase domain protein [Desulfatibacillum aliphaticivorans]
MDLSFSSTQKLLRDSAAKFLSAECPYARVKEIEDSEQGYDPVLWAQMADLGWLGCALPEEYGGTASSFVDLIIIQEEIGRRLAPSPFFSTVVQCSELIRAGGSEEQKSELLNAIAEGRLIMSLAQYEPEASYLESGIKMQAIPQGDQYILSGVKMFAMDANICGKLIAAARVPDMGVTLFLVDADHPDISISKIPTIGKDNACEVVLNNAAVSRSDVIGEVGDGWALLEKMNAKAAVGKAAEMVGGSKACVTMTGQYAKMREQYGVPIGGNQAIQHYLANMLVAYDTSYSYLYQVACMVDEGKDFALEASTLKACCNQNYKFITERAVQIHGAIGTTRECDISLFYRKAKACEYACGDTFLHLDNIADNLL